MGKKCFVPMCNTGYNSCTEKVSIFLVPKHNLHEWQRAIPRKDRCLTLTDAVCEKHFNPEDVIRELRTECYTIPLGIPKLSKTAIPSKFPDCSTHSTNSTHARGIIKKKDILPFKTITEKNLEEDTIHISEQKTDGEECKSRWKNLRGSLTRNLSQKLKFQGNKTPKTFYLTKYMEFVLPFAKSKHGHPYETVTVKGSDPSNYEDGLFADNAEVKEDSQDSWEAINVKGNIEFVDENESCEGNLSKSSIVLKQSVSNPTTSTAMAPRDPLDPRPEPEPPISLDHGDADKHFLLSLLPHIHCLTANEKLQFQIRTLNVINEIMNEREKFQ